MDVRVELAGRTLYPGAGNGKWTRAKGGEAGASWGAYTPPATLFLQIALDDLGLVRQGRNPLTITLDQRAEASQVELVEIQFGVLTTRRIFIWR